jgi:hypothetical protein
MSSLRVVRRLLQQTSELASSSATDPATSTEKEQLKKQRLRRQLAKQAKIPVDEQTVVQHQVNVLLMLDGTMSSTKNKKHVTASRLREKQVAAKHKEKQAKKVLGNSRSSSSALTTKAPPTFNKKLYKKRKEEKNLANIAKMLKKAKNNKTV